jgi:hypothetical protein
MHLVAYLYEDYHDAGRWNIKYVSKDIIAFIFEGTQSKEVQEEWPVSMPTHEDKGTTFLRNIYTGVLISP